MFKSLFVSLILLFFFFSSINFSYGQEVLKGNLFNDKGKVTLQKGGQGSSMSVTAGKCEPVGAGDMIQTGPESLAHLEFSDGSLINIQGNTSLQIKTLVTEGNKNRSIFGMIVGTISVFVNKITGKEQDYEVETPSSVASVRGTQFQMNVYVDEDYKGKESEEKAGEGQENKSISVVSVQEGSVELSSADRTKILDTLEANTSAFVTPDTEFHRMNEFINLVEMSPDEIKGRVRGEIENYLYQHVPRPNLPF